MKRSQKKFFVFVMIAVIFLSLLGYSWADKKPSVSVGGDYLIVGGKRVGPVQIGSSISLYKNFLGPAKKLGEGFYDFPKRGVAILVKGGVIRGIMVYSPLYKTSQGLKVGVSVKDLTKCYGDFLKTDAGSLSYSELGLAFNEKNGKIIRIMVVDKVSDNLMGDKLIIPGNRAGNIKIGMDVAYVKKSWGEPASANPVKGASGIFLYKYNRKAVKFLVNDSIIQGIQINSYKFRTAEGIGIGSTRAQVVKTYGKVFRQVNDSIMYTSMGLGFYFNNDKVVEILLTYPR